MKTRSGITYGENQENENGYIKMDINLDVYDKKLEKTKVKEEKKFNKDLDSLLSLFTNSSLDERDKDIDLLDSLFTKININKKKRKYYRKFGYRKKKVKT
tara:strand:+ start:154 stop:453 length:300 start_codon:yes stop_codon:yes gene_type:complete